MLDFHIVLAGLLGGAMVGATGMGGGALMTPALILLFGIDPLAAVSSDIVASMIMKPVGAAVHLRQRTVHRQLVLWLGMGSVPASFLGVLVLEHFGRAQQVQHWVRLALGFTLLLVVVGLIARARLARGPSRGEVHPARLRPAATAIVGVLGGLVVGVTSVGSGSLMMMMLLLLYPSLRLSELVGTDLVQAIPLTASAAVAHLLFGDFQPGITASILVGSIPGIYLGARFSSVASDRMIRPLLVLALSASALGLLGAGSATTAVLATAMGLTSAMSYGQTGAVAAPTGEQG